MEAQNKLLKYKYMPRLKSPTLSAIVVLIIEDFMPEMQSKYICFKIMACHQTTVLAHSNGPQYLRGQPCRVILHCLVQKQKLRTFSEASSETGLEKGKQTQKGIQEGKNTTLYIISRYACTDHLEAADKNQDKDCAGNPNLLTCML